MAMPTDKERREVARRLRELAMTYKGVFGVHILDAIGLEFTDSHGACCSNDSVRRLADLIEPPLQCPHYDSGKHWCGVHDAPAIDRNALLELADAMDEEADAADDAARCALLPGGGPMGERAARRHRGATADRERRDACKWRTAALIVRDLCGEEGR